MPEAARVRSALPNPARRTVLRGALGAAVVGGLTAACSSATTSKAAATPTVRPTPDGDITWFTWSQYVADSVVKGFQEKYGVQVKQTFFDSDEAMLQKLATGLPYDLVTTNSAYLPRAVQAGLVQGFRWSDLDTSDLDSYFDKPVYDAGTVRYSIPYGAGGTGFLYKKSEVTDPTSWNTFWKSTTAKGKITVLDQSEETIGMALLHLGMDLNSGDPKKITDAVDALLTIKPSLEGISSDTTSDVEGGNVWLAHTWSGSAFQTLEAMKDASAWAYTQPAGATPVGSDLLSIGANAKSPGTALLFMDWILKPANSRANASYTGYLTGTKSGDAAVAALTSKYPFLSVPADFYQTALWKQAPSGARQKIMTEQWARFNA